MTASRDSDEGARPHWFRTVHGKVWAWVAGIAATVVAGVIIAILGINRSESLSVTIDGPMVAQIQVPFTLTGRISGKYDKAYWTDSFGESTPYDVAETEFTCDLVGTFYVTLTAESSANRAQATHLIACTN